MTKKLFIYIAAMMSLAACSDDINWDNGSHISPDGTIDFTVSVPQMQVVSTRAASVDENSVSKIDMYIFSGTGEDATLVQSNPDIDFDESGSDYKFKVLLKKGVNAGDNLCFYFIANLHLPESETISEGTTLATFRAMTQSVTTDKGLMVMSGKHVGTTNLDGTTIPLVRNGAKFTVHDKNDSEDYTGECDYPFEVVNTASSSSIVAGVDGILGTAKAAKNVSNFSNDKTDIEYVYPTENSRKGPYVIVKADYNTRPYYYCLTLKDEDGSNMNVNPNHWYQIVIMQIKGAGASTPEEAMESPIDPGENSVADYEIHDHSPAIYNMITDGRRELGVSYSVSHNGNITGNEETVGYLYVKVFDHDNTLKFSEVKEEISFEEDDVWFDIVNSPTDATAETLEGGGTVGGGPNYENSTDINSQGIVLKYPVKFKKSTQIGSQNGNVKVKWNKLSRNVDIIWTRDFNGADLCDVTLYMYDDTDTQQGPDIDYWPFLNSSLKGIKPEENNGKIRNAGLHFPVMYGKKGKSMQARWSYAYRVEFSKLSGSFDWYVTFSDGEKDEYEVTDAILKDWVKIHVDKMDGTEAPTSFENKMTHSSGNLVLWITRAGNVFQNDGSTVGLDNDYKYGTGKLLLKVVPKDGVVREEDIMTYAFDLYHTGFFHKNTSTGEAKRLSGSDTGNYYYYEVVPVDGSVCERYILDRNVGAESAGMFVTDQGSVYYGDEEKSFGGYYKGAEYNQYNNPTMNDFIAPPGYCIPSQGVWDDIRNSGRFSMASKGSYYTSEYKTDSKAGTIYFPKVEYYNKSNNTSSIQGESRAGYYWTSTAASGLEKEEVGRWLKAYSLSGTASSYINANVDKYYMQVRCVNEIEENTTKNRTAFNVSGVTHVFLYTLSNGTKTAITTWPGKAIGNSQTMGPGKDSWFNYSYESEVMRPEDLYVVFNYVNSDGVIYTVAKNGKGTSVNLKDIEGWKAVDDTDTGLRDTSKESGFWGVPTANNYWWKIKDANSSSAKAYCYKQNPGDELQSVETTDYTYQLRGNFNNGWNNYEMTKSGSYWVYKINANANSTFGIRKMANDTQVAWISGSSTFVIGNNLCSEDNGTNWTISEEGKYTFTFDPIAMTLKAEMEEIDSNATVTYRIYWFKESRREYIRYKIGNGSYKIVRYQGEEYAYNSQRWYYDITCKASDNLWVLSCKSDGTDMHPTERNVRTHEKTEAETNSTLSYQYKHLLF